MITATSGTRPIIIYAPQGCGKSRHAAQFLAHFGGALIDGEWADGDPLPADALVLTNVPPPYKNSRHAGVLSYEEALALSAPVDRAA